MSNDSFVFYRSFYEALEDMDNDTLAETMRALCEYALNGTEPNVKGWAKSVMTLVRPQIDANNKRRENATKGGRPKKEKPMVSENTEKEKPMVSENAQIEKPKCENPKPNVNDNVNVNVNVNDIKESKEKSPRARFVKPRLDDVLRFTADANLSGDMNQAQAFIDYYEANGWKVGRNAMKDWKSAWRNWLRRKEEFTPKQKPQNRFNNYKGRDYGNVDQSLKGLIAM